MTQNCIVLFSLGKHKKILPKKLSKLTLRITNSIINIFKRFLLCSS